MSEHSLPKRRLARSGFDITPVGFGAWAIGGPDWGWGWGTQDDAQSIAAIRHAVARGINWIDTAPVYGLGHSEEIVREALSTIPRSERPLVFTKAGLVWDPEKRNALPARIGDAKSLRREVEDSLRRLDVEVIDLYQMHWPANDGTPIEEYWATFADLKAEGKVRAIGLSNHDRELLQRAATVAPVDVVQPPFSAIKRGFAEEGLPWVRAHGSGVLAYSPLQSGLLTGAFTPSRARALPENDWRSRDEEFAGEALYRNLAFADELRPIAARHHATVAAVAAAWVLAWPGITGAIIGARKPEHIDGWIDAATIALSPRDLDDIEDMLLATRAGSGPTRPDLSEAA
ncbi:aldo/keto reductase [Sinorhizobium americanum]|uniref:Aldo/keto reductase n=1 Tax=Sinorhizobium americanum TaxID=194963 RepID=A0A1L3LTT4_9HYPH|nr:aldo/keto reductase [Sinorhizobium americanum]APG93495.1 aldo/keto reductase [Sinorhizobium americanum]